MMETLETIDKTAHIGFKKKSPIQTILATPQEEIIYPDSDGEPMSDNTLHYQWIVKIVENLDNLFLNNPNVFVGGDLLWYPVKGRNDIRIGPDAMVAFGRPKGYRGSYMTWLEDNIVPQVVFEVRSPRNTSTDMAKKLHFYNVYGVEEYYMYDPHRRVLKGWIRSGEQLSQIVQMNGWLSPRLNIRFVMKDDLVIIDSDEREFLLPSISIALERQKAETERKKAETERKKAETERKRAETQRKKVETERKRAEAERQRAETERQRAETERQRAETERQRADNESWKAEIERQRAETERQLKERLAAKLRELGIDPDL
jgi:Uma2 family endonuclease